LLFLYLVKGLKKGLVFILPLILWLYQIWRWLRQRIIYLFQLNHQNFFYLIVNRYFLHFLLFLIILSTSLGTLQVQAGSFPENATGESSLLFEFFNQEEIIEDNSLPSSNDSQDFFLDMPIEELEPEIPSTLQNQALAKIQLSPLGMTPTRIRPEEYIVQPGDTVTSIANRFGVSINTILWENKLSPTDLIRPGQKLIILPVTGVSHKVKKGETIEQLAKIYGVFKEEILEFNGLSEKEALVPGQLLIIPGGVPPFLSPRSPTRVSQPSRLTVPSKPSKTLPPPKSVPAGLAFIWPVDTWRITQYFSWRHPAIDLAGPVGSPIYAVREGVVVLVEKRYTGYGWQVMIDHENGFKTRYAHLSEIFVSPGQRVEKGEIIGLRGSTGRSSGPHLHFEIDAYGRRVNPLDYLGR
jgi:murein DD-endopeptidase MepM/ murein hydrolase activator NlpD